MISEEQRLGTCLKDGKQTSLRNFLTDVSDGDYSYLGENGTIFGFDMDNSMWRLDDDIVLSWTKEAAFGMTGYCSALMKAIIISRNLDREHA